MVWSCRLSKTARESTIVGGTGALKTLAGEAGRAANGGARLFVLTDENVQQAWGSTVLGLLQPAADPGDLICLQPGEASKSIQVVSRCWDRLASLGARRNDIVVALGGGVVGDIAGFVAATHLRGLGLWQIPTSLLAQVDSSVGGKNGVNLAAGKNLVGSFYQPQLVVIDSRTLATLPEEEYRSGLGEVVKYGLLYGEEVFSLLEAQAELVRLRDSDLVSDLVERCVGYKANVVEEDEFDQGRRAVLNLGHTTGHALESVTGYGRLAHGTAVALGLVVALALSERLLGLDPELRTRTCALLTALGLPVAIDLPPTDELVQAAFHDKKVVGGRLLFVGLAAVGAPVWGVDVPAEAFAEALEVIRA